MVEVVIRTSLAAERPASGMRARVVLMFAVGWWLSECMFSEQCQVESITGFPTYVFVTLSE